MALDDANCLSQNSYFSTLEKKRFGICLQLIKAVQTVDSWQLFYLKMDPGVTKLGTKLSQP